MSDHRENMRPNTSLDDVKEYLLNFYGFECLEIKELDCYLDRTFYVKVNWSKRQDGTNERVIGSDDFKEFIFKILNSVDSAKEHFEAEHDIRKLLNKHGFICPRTVKNKFNEFKSLININHLTADGTMYTRTHVIRLLTFISGELLGDVPISIRLLTSVGIYLADMQEVIKDFKHPGLHGYDQILYSFENIGNLKDLFHYIKKDAKKELLDMALKTFEVNVVPKFYQVERGTIHCDFHGRNIIVDKNSTPEGNIDYEITGVIDFGDLVTTCLVFDLACSIAHMMLEKYSPCSDPLDVGGYLLKGYLNRRNLSPIELEMLPHCVMGRFAQMQILGAYTQFQYPENEYLLSWEGSWKMLESLMEIGVETMLWRWLKIVEEK